MFFKELPSPCSSFIKSSLFLLLSSVFLFACVSHKDLLNIQSINDKEKAVNSSTEASEYLLQQGDMLSIKVASLDPQSVAIFNKTIGQASSTQLSEAGIYMNSYIVNDSGMVNLPIVGNVKVAGMTLGQAQQLLSVKMDLYYKFSSVDVKIMSFRVTVIGEVALQGTFVIYNTSTNILQAIGQAGGITDMGNRKKIRVIRKNEKQSTLAYIDLYSDQLIASEYYQLQPNDIIYVEPLKAKAKRLNLPAVQAILSGLTFIVVVLTYIQRQ